jgi:hypothetical protein
MLGTSKPLNTNLNILNGRFIAIQQPSLLNIIIIMEYSDSDKLDSENFKDITTFAFLFVFKK